MNLNQVAAVDPNFACIEKMNHEIAFIFDKNAPEFSIVMNSRSSI